MPQQKKEQPKSSDNNGYKYYAQFLGITLQMGVIIFLGASLGKWLDAKYPAEKSWYTILCTILAVAVALYLFVQQSKRLNK